MFNPFAQQLTFPNYFGNFIPWNYPVYYYPYQNELNNVPEIVSQNGKNESLIKISNIKIESPVNISISGKDKDNDKDKEQEIKSESLQQQQFPLIEDVKKEIKKKRKQSELKNTETNIINQMFAYLSKPQKSQKDLQYLLDHNEEKIKIFYAYMKSLKKIKGKYLNKQYLINLVFFPEKTSQNKMIMRSKYRNQILSINQLRRVMIRITLKFLRGNSVLTLIESNRIKQATLQTHLQRRRSLVHQILEQASVINLKSKQ